MLTSKLYLDCVIYGPYLYSDNRRRVVVYKDKTIIIVLAYARFLYQEYIDRLLSENEEVHHKDENTLNDTLENYELLTGTEHRRRHAKYQEDEAFVCPWCDKVFIIPAKKLAKTYINRKKGSAGPFCTHNCAAKYRGSQQLRS